MRVADIALFWGGIGFLMGVCAGLLFAAVLT